MRLQTIALSGFAAVIACALALGMSSRGTTSVKASLHLPIDITAITKAATNLPDQAYPAY